MHPFNLENETALITGGGSGLGLGIAACFVQAGAKVIVVGRTEQTLQSAIETLGPNACYIQHDITHLNQAAALIE